MHSPSVSPLIEQYLKQPVWLTTMRIPSVYKEVWMLILWQTAHHPTKRTSARLSIRWFMGYVMAGRGTIQAALKDMVIQGLLGSREHSFRTTEYWTRKPETASRPARAVRPVDASLDRPLDVRDHDHPEQPVCQPEKPADEPGPVDDLVDDLVTLGFTRGDAVSTVTQRPKNYMFSLVEYVKTRLDQIRNPVGYIKDGAKRGNYLCPPAHPGLTATSAVPSKSITLSIPQPPNVPHSRDSIPPLIEPKPETRYTLTPAVTYVPYVPCLHALNTYCKHSDCRESDRYEERERKRERAGLEA